MTWSYWAIHQGCFCPKIILNYLFFFIFLFLISFFQLLCPATLVGHWARAVALAQALTGHGWLGRPHPSRVRVASPRQGSPLPVVNKGDPLLALSGDQPSPRSGQWWWLVEFTYYPDKKIKRLLKYIAQIRSIWPYSPPKSRCSLFRREL